MLPDTTFIEPVTDLVTNPSIIEWLTNISPVLGKIFTAEAVIGLVVLIIVSAIAYLVGKFKLSKPFTAQIIEVITIIITAIIDAKNIASKSKAGYKDDAIVRMSINFANKEIENSNADLTKTVKKIGGLEKAITAAYPIVCKHII